MTVQTDKIYKIDIFQDRTFRQNSTDNSNIYDFEYLEKIDYNFPSMFGIKVYSDDTLIKSAIIGSDGGGTADNEKSKIIENERIVVCCANSVFCLTIPDLTLLWQTKADEVICFEVLKYKDSYIVHGELEITRIDSGGEIIWQKSGADIFATPSSDNHIQLTDDFIIATDWDNRTYKFGYDGQDYTDMKQFAKN